MKPPSKLSDTMPTPPSHQPTLLSLHERQSMAAPREPRLHSPWKRSACDRCRSLKLKCKRDNENMAQPCIRCSRADAACCTSPAKSSARLARTQTNAKFASPACSSTDMVDVRPRRESRTPIPIMRINSNNASNQESTFLMRWPFTHAATIDIDFDVDMPLPMGESGQANYFDSFVNFNEPPFHLDHLSSPNPSSARELPSGADSVISHLAPSSYTQTDTQSPVFSDEVIPGILLADLQHNLSK
ncbi:hypothetical protein F4803DRAFT_521981 [Xylaria telfairii]|nr:hypothetical protein F4803DRAFT_521981 [Xylaria telfairii]